MLATPTIFAKEVVGLTERGSATIDLHNVVRHFDKMISLLKRKCKERCSLKRRLEEYCAFRLGTQYFEKHYGVSFDDEAGLVEKLEHIVEMFESQNTEATDRD